jgi:hypothetical protein
VGYTKRGRNKSAGKINHTKTTVNGVNVSSKLEAFMYKALKDAGIPFKYEGKVYTLMEAFHFPNKSYERMSNGKGDMVDRGNKKVRAITYKPDFIGDGWVIETKGHANESFPLRWKLFKQLIKNDDIVLFKPQRQGECIDVVQLILKMQKEKENEQP